MVDIILWCNNFYEKRIVEVVFAAKCSSTHEVFMHIIKDLKVCAIHSPANIWMVFSFFSCFWNILWVTAALVLILSCRWCESQIFCVCVWKKIFYKSPHKKFSGGEVWTSWGPWNWSASSNLLIRKSHVIGFFCSSWLKWVVALSCWNKILSYSSVPSVCGKTNTCDISRSVFAIAGFQHNRKCL